MLLAPLLSEYHIVQRVDKEVYVLRVDNIGVNLHRFAAHDFNANVLVHQSLLVLTTQNCPISEEIHTLVA